MEPIIKELLNFTFIYIMLIGMTIFAMNVLSKGYLLTLLRVKASRGKLILIRIKNPIGFYFKTGRYDNGFFCFKTKDKIGKRLEISPDLFENYVFHSHGVAEIITNEKGDVYVSKDLTVDRFHTQDPASNDVLYNRIQMTPKRQTNEQKVAIVLLIIIMLALMFMFYKLMTIQDTLNLVTNIGGVIS